MKVIETDIEGVVIIEPKVFADDRGDIFLNHFHKKSSKRKYVKPLLCRTMNQNRPMVF